MAADISLPAGETSFLTRVRGISRLWVDGKEVVSTKPAAGRRTDGHNPVTPLATPPKANHRVKGYHQQEVVGTLSLEKEESKESFSNKLSGVPTKGRKLEKPSSQSKVKMGSYIIFSPQSQIICQF